MGVQDTKHNPPRDAYRRDRGTRGREDPAISAFDYDDSQRRARPERPAPPPHQWSPETHPLLALQRQAGNAAVTRWLTAKDAGIAVLAPTPRPAIPPLSIQRQVVKKTRKRGKKEGEVYWISTRDPKRRKTQFPTKQAALRYEEGLDSGQDSSDTDSSPPPRRAADTDDPPKERKRKRTDDTKQQDSADEGGHDIEFLQKDHPAEEELLPEPANKKLRPSKDEVEEHSQVISGHGSLNEKRLPISAAEPSASGRARRGKPVTTFRVPAGMTVVFYAPPGAALDNAVANRVEKGEALDVDELELKQNDSGSGKKGKALPDQFPYVFGEGTDVTNYTVAPPDRLVVTGTPVTVKEPTLLAALVQQAQENGFTKVHYACCSVERGMKNPGKWAGWYVRFKTPQ